MSLWIPKILDILGYIQDESQRRKGAKMLMERLASFITEETKLSLRSKYSEIKSSIITLLYKYDGEKLKSKLSEMGISDTDTLLVHANFKTDSGFRGIPLDVVNTLIELVGKRGNLMMVSIPFRGSAYDYLAKNKPFRVNKTMSMMGLITEVFRRNEGVSRSLHPTHPVLVYGKDSAWLVADHEKCLYPCGPGTPFEKLRQLGGKILFFDVGFGAITFFHYVEDIIKDKLPFAVYHNEPFSVTVYDKNDEMHVVTTYVFNRTIARSAQKLEREMEARGLIKKGKVGNSKLLLVNAEDVVTCQTAMVLSGKLPYDFENVTGGDSGP